MGHVFLCFETLVHVLVNMGVKPTSPFNHESSIMTWWQWIIISYLILITLVYNSGYEQFQCMGESFWEVSLTVHTNFNASGMTYLEIHHRGKSSSHVWTWDLKHPRLNYEHMSMTKEPMDLTTLARGVNLL